MTVQTYLVMKMHACGVTGSSHGSQDIPSGHPLSHFDFNPGHMTIQGFHFIGMPDNDSVAIAFVPPSYLHDPIRRGLDGRAFGIGDIKTGVIAEESFIGFIGARERTEP
jgi:hypothetical protein